LYKATVKKTVRACNGDTASDCNGDAENAGVDSRGEKCTWEAVRRENYNILVM